MIVTDDADVAARIRVLRSHGMTTLSWDRHRGHASDYDVVALGYNYRIDEPRAALAECRLARLDAENRQRAELDERYRRALDDVDGVASALPPAEDAELAHHLFAVVLEAELDRAEVRRQLAERRIQTSVHYPPVHGFSIYSDPDAHLPLTEAYGARTVTLPLFAHMTETQQDQVLGSLKAAIANSAPVHN